MKPLPERLAAALFLVGLLVAAGHLLRVHLEIVAFPYQMEYREAAVPLFTDLMVRGGDPYDLAHQPRYANVYGIGYHLAVYPFARAFGATLQVHRAVSAAFILGASALLFAVARRRGAGVLPVLAVALILWATLLHRMGPLARPDAMGTFLFLAAVWVPWWFRFSAPALVASVVLGLLAFLTKPYFILALPITAAYLFLSVSKQRGVAFALGTAAGLIGTIALADALWETYLFNTFAIHVTARTYHFEWVLRQLAWGLVGYGELVLIGAVLAVPVLVRGWREGWARAVGGFSIDLRHADRPLLTPALDPAVFGLLVTSVVFVYPLGGHLGAFMTYLEQLVLPFLLVLAAGWIGRAATLLPRVPGLAHGAAAALTLACLLGFAFAMLPRVDWSQEAEQWRAVARLIAPYERVYGSPAIAGILLAQGKTVYDSGQVEYFRDATARLPAWAREREHRAQERVRAEQNEVDAAIRAQKMELLVLPETATEPVPERAQRLGEQYRYRGTYTLPMPYTAATWRVEFWSAAGPAETAAESEKGVEDFATEKR